MTLTATLFLSACASSPDLVRPEPAEQRVAEPNPRALVGGVALHLDVTPLAETAPPTGVAFEFGEQLRWLDAENRWQIRSELTPLGPQEFTLTPIGGHRLFFPMRIALAATVRSDTIFRAPLIPRHSLRSTPYVDLLDLLQEFLFPRSGSRVARWQTLPIRVALPERATDDPYRTSCAEAIADWNEALGTTWLQTVSDPDASQVICTVAEEPPLGYTLILERDTRDNPLRLRVHLSPRFNPEFPRYIRRAWMHEFGHVLGLWGHSRSMLHLVNGRAVIVDDPHPDEIAALRRLYDLPRGFDLSWVVRSWRSTQPNIDRCPLDSADFPLPRQAVLH
jgi:hypothetical protein